MEIIQVKIEDLKPAEYNPRAMTEKEKEDLMESIRRFGMVEPIVANSAKNRKNIIIGGHQRFNICKELGWKEIPVVYANIPDEKKEKELNLRLNRNTGHWDFDLLAKFDESLLLDTGFDTGEIDEIFGLGLSKEFDEEKEFEKSVKKPKGVKLGQIWKLGEHKLLIGDCTKKENWEKLMGEERFDFMFTDPPYRLAYCKKGKGKPKGFGANQNRIYEGVEIKGGVPEFDEWISIANEFQNPKGANVMIFENWRNTVDLWQAIEKYWKIRNMIIWHLPNRMQGFAMRQQFFNKYDIAPLAGDGVNNEQIEEEMEKYILKSGQKLLDTYEVIIFAKKGDSVCDKKKGTQYAKVSDHITWTASTEKSGGQSLIFGTKPLQVLVPYIKILSPRNGIVVEPFGGSGSTIIASEIMKRRCRAMELSETYAEVIISRFEQFTGKKAELLNLA